MNETLKALYDNFYEPASEEQRNAEIERCRQALSEKLSKEDRRLVLKIIDCKDQIAEAQSFSSFIAGFLLGWKLSNELKDYNLEHPVSANDFIK